MLNSLLTDTLTRITPTALAKRLFNAGQVLLMLDYDGTLVPLAPTPAQARPAAELLRILKKLGGRPQYKVAVISGRTLSDLTNLLPVPGIFLIGGHGIEVMSPYGEVTHLLDHKHITKIINELEQLARCCLNDKDGFLLENKGYSLAIHYRLAGPSMAKGALNKFIELSKPIIQKHGLNILPGKKVLEIRPLDIHKGKAVNYLQQLYPHSLAVYYGDDTTDEDAFRALKEGLSILVSPRTRVSAAKFKLNSSLEVLEVLTLLLEK
ncbi:MAG TPA: trehalose-phosphatase [Desulfotomaculum sp.]|nr:trehalose-phosphatase [Desulfotomaculum sp.]